MGNRVFAVPVFFIVFRETVETSIIVAILLAFIKQLLTNEGDRPIRRRLIRQVWAGTFAGLLVCIVIGAGLIGAFYGLRKDMWTGAEDVYEAVFSLIACIIITLMGAALLRISKLREKWRTKLTSALEGKDLTKKYAAFLLPFITVLREGLEAVVFVGGVGLDQPASAFPLPVITGLLAGALVGYVLYRGRSTVAMHWFLIISTSLLYLVAAGLLSKAAWSFDMYQFAKLVGGDVAETGSGPGSYNIHRTVWHVNCCSPKLNGGGGWGIFNSIFGWQNTATYSSVISYNVYWIVVATYFIVARYRERTGKYPFMKAKANSSAPVSVEEGPMTTGKEVEQEIREVKEE